MVAHLQLAKEHMATYADESGRLGFCDHTPVLADFDGMKEFGRPVRYYRLDNLVYTSKKEWLKALEHITL